LAFPVAHRGDGKRFVVHAEDASVAFVELEAQSRELHERLAQARR
jgi:hypothetical protein